MKEKGKYLLLNSLSPSPTYDIAPVVIFGHTDPNQLSSIGTKAKVAPKSKIEQNIYIYFVVLDLRKDLMSCPPQAFLWLQRHH